MGVFSVQVYPDGFVVSSRQFGDTLEISNVGQNFVFVRDIGPLGTATAVAQAGLSMTCTVSALAYTLMRGSGHRTASHNTTTPEVLWQRACSAAMYIPAPLRVEAELVVPGDDPEVCRPRPSGPAPKRWKLWGRHEVRGLEGKVVLGRRGGCMFEDKTMVAQVSQTTVCHLLLTLPRLSIAAQNANASGLIVANNEDFLFIISGKKDEEEDKPSQLAAPLHKRGSRAAALEASRRQGAPPRHHPEARIPTVMLTKVDADALVTLSIARKGRADSVLRVRVDVDSVPAALDMDALGFAERLRLRVRENMVYVCSRSGWGVALASTNGQEWQLFILSRGDAEALQLVPHLAKTRAGHDVSFSHVVSASSGSVALRRYWQMLAAQSPAHLSFDAASNSLTMD